MTTAHYGIVPGAFKSCKASLTAAIGTAARILVEPQPAQAASVNAPLLFGGATVIAATAASSDSVDQKLTVWGGTVLTTVGANTGSAATTTGSATRTSGSYIADGWRVGDGVMLFAAADSAPNASVDGVLGIVSGVAALTLTVNGTPFVAGGLSTGTRMCRMAPMFTTLVGKGSGTNGVNANVTLLGNGLDSSALQTESKLGDADLIAISSVSAVSALPAMLSAQAQIARY